nr:hypothetical protein [Leptospira interrogans]
MFPIQLMVEGVTPLQISILSPMQLADKNTAVFGLRLNLFYGVNSRISSIDLGLFNVTDFKGPKLVRL